MVVDGFLGLLDDVEGVGFAVALEVLVEHGLPARGVVADLGLGDLRLLGRRRSLLALGTLEHVVGVRVFRALVVLRVVQGVLRVLRVRRRLLNVVDLAVAVGGPLSGPAVAPPVGGLHLLEHGQVPVVHPRGLAVAVEVQRHLVHRVGAGLRVLGGGLVVGVVVGGGGQLDDHHVRVVVAPSAAAAHFRGEALPVMRRGYSAAHQPQVGEQLVVGFLRPRSRQRARQGHAQPQQTRRGPRVKRRHPDTTLIPNNQYPTQT